MSRTFLSNWRERSVLWLTSLLAAVLVLPGAAGAATLSATPSAFAGAVSSAQAGDTVLLASGSYGTWSGTNKAITIKADDGASPTMRYDFTTGDQGFTLDGLGGMGGSITDGANHITIKNSVFTTYAHFDGLANSAIVFDHNTHNGINSPSGAPNARLGLYNPDTRWPSSPASIFADNTASDVLPPLPPIDTDGDGIPNAVDQCPTQSGPAPSGCPTPPPPPADADGDGVPDSSDNCPNTAGPASNHGCPTPPPPPATTGNNCMSNPSACGFPDLENTGVTPGTALTNVSGVVTLSTPGQVYENKKVTGQIVVTATNVTIRNVKLVMTDGFYGIKVTPGGSWSRSDANLTVDHVEIDMGGGMDGKAIAFSGFTVKSTFFHNGADCAHFGSNVLIQDSLCVIGPDTNGDGQPDSTGFCSGPSHFDGFQDDGGGNFAMRHNTVRNPCGQTSAMLISDDPADTFGDISVTDNLMAGGGYTLYCPNTANGNTTITGNRFARTYFGTGGAYGPTTYCNQADTYSANVWDDTGKTF